MSAFLLADNGLFGLFENEQAVIDLQSAYRLGHSTETAILKILMVVDEGSLAALTLLSLSVTLDSDGHDTVAMITDILKYQWCCDYLVGIVSAFLDD